MARDPRGELADFDLVITTYGLVRRQDWLAQRQWPLIVLDEAQAIKNASSAQTRGVKKLPAGCRIVLTGTPVENHLGDLWSLFDFCSPGLLGTAGEFKNFIKGLNKQQDSHAFGGLRRLVRPYILRRLKTDPEIAPDLPDKTEMRTECGLSKKQAALYEQAVEDLAKRLKDAEGIARRGLVLAMLMRLKQICNHPAQYFGGAAFVPAESGKFERLALLCEPIVERQEKMLVFTQFQVLTQPLADYLATVFGHAGLVLHGGTPVASVPIVRVSRRADPPVLCHLAQSGRQRAESHRRFARRPLRPLVEPGRRKSGDRPGLSHRPKAKRASPQIRLPWHGRRADRRHDPRQTGPGRSDSQSGKRDAAHRVERRCPAAVRGLGHRPSDGGMSVTLPAATRLAAHGHEM